MTVGSQVKSCFSSIKSAEATLHLLANKTKDEQSKKMYQNVQQVVSEVKADLQQQVIYIVNEEPKYK